MTTAFNNSNQIESPDYSIPFLGQVWKNDDPEKLQRVKIRVEGLLEGVDEDPWVAPMMWSPFGHGPTFGACAVPALNSLAVVYFQGESIYYGLLHGYLATSAAPVPTELATHYPNRWGFKDPAGHLFFMDRTSGSRTVEFHHGSGGMSLVIGDTGSVTLFTKENISVHTEKSATVQVDKSATVTVGDTASVSVTNSATVTCGTFCTVKAPTVTLDTTNTIIKGETISITGTSAVNVTGPTNIVGETSVTGSTTVSAGVIAATMSAATSLKVSGHEVLNHTHQYTDDDGHGNHNPGTTAGMS